RPDFNACAFCEFAACKHDDALADDSVEFASCRGWCCGCTFVHERRWIHVPGIAFCKLLARGWVIRKLGVEGIDAVRKWRMRAAPKPQRLFGLRSCRNGCKKL